MPKHTVNHPLSNRRQAILGALLVIFACVAAEIATRAGSLDTLEYTYYDLWHNLVDVRVEPKHVVIVSVDNQTLLDHQDEPLAFWGPHFARAIEVLRRAGARIIGLDYLFRASAESWLRKLDLPGSDKSRTYDIPMRAQLAAGQVVLIGTIAGSDHGQSELLLPVNDYLFVLPGGRMDVGLSNFYPDKDEMVRRFVPALLDDGTTPSLTFATLLAVRAAGLNPEKDSWSLGGQRVFNTPFPRRIGFVGPPRNHPPPFLWPDTQSWGRYGS